MSVEKDVTEIKTLLTGPLGVIETLGEIKTTIADNTKAVEQRLDAVDSVAQEAQATADQAKEIAVAGNSRIWKGLAGLVLLAAGVIADFTLRRT